MDNSVSAKVITSDAYNVTGSFVITDKQTSPDRCLRPSALFACAENLMEQSTALSTDATVLVDSSAQFIDLSYAENINAAAQVVLQQPGFTLWEVRLSTFDDQEIARIKLSYVCQKTTPVSKQAQPISKKASGQKTKSTNKRDAIAKAACEVIAEKGFAAATMREIATAAHMHVPTMYQYVRSKEEVLELVYRTEISQVRENVRPALEKNLPAMEKLLGIAASFVRSNGEMRKEAGVLNRELRSLSHQARSRVLADYAELMDEISQIIANGTAAGEIRVVEPELVANMIDAICDLWALRPFAISGVQEETFLQEALSFIENGLKAAP